MTFFGGLQTKVGIRSIISKNAFVHHRQFWWCHSSLNRKYYFCFWYCQLLLKTHRCIVRCFVQFYWILNTFLIRVKVKKERPHQSFWDVITFWSLNKCFLTILKWIHKFPSLLDSRTSCPVLHIRYFDILKHFLKEYFLISFVDLMTSLFS